MDEAHGSEPVGGARRVAPYGTWASPISAASLARGAIGVSDLRTADGRLFWLESRPDEGGRMVLMTRADGEARQLTPAGFNVRTRVHEYGGAPYVVIDKTVYFSNFSDQKLYAQPIGGESAEAPSALTPEGYRYADLVAAPGEGLIGVREDHTDPADVKNAVVRLSGKAGDAGEVLFGDSDFVAYPRVSPDGKRLAWMAWDHPNMPWDDTTLLVAELTAEGLGATEAVAGGVGKSAMEPKWGADGTLYFISDRSGFWNLYAWADGEARPVLPSDAEFAGPLWGFGQSNYVPLADGRIVARRHGPDHDELLVDRPGRRRARNPPPLRRPRAPSTTSTGGAWPCSRARATRPPP